MPGRLDCYGDSHRGLVRARNEDQFLIADLRKSVVVHQTSLSYDDDTELHGRSQAKLMLVADGVGGSCAGERASCLALESVVQYLLNAMHWLFRPDDALSSGFVEDLKSALQYSQERIQQAAVLSPKQQGMGTTLTMAYVVWPMAFVVHAGDSRAYLLRGERLQQLTSDQTYAQALADAGVITQDQVACSPLNHVLFSLLGCDPSVLTPMVMKSTLELNDTLLLCTDGLTQHVPEHRITAILNREPCARGACHRLIQSALDGGGSDNITAVVAKFHDRLAMPFECESATADTESDSGIDISLSNRKPDHGLHASAGALSTV